jgi:hypothetical protein
MTSRFDHHKAVLMLMAIWNADRCSRPHSQAISKHAVAAAPGGDDLTTWWVPKASQKYKNETAG